MQENENDKQKQNNSGEFDTWQLSHMNIIAQCGTFCLGFSTQKNSNVKYTIISLDYANGTKIVPAAGGMKNKTAICIATFTSYNWLCM